MAVILYTFDGLLLRDSGTVNILGYNSNLYGRVEDDQYSQEDIEVIIYNDNEFQVNYSVEIYMYNSESESWTDSASGTIPAKSNVTLYFGISSGELDSY